MKYSAGGRRWVMMMKLTRKGEVFLTPAASQQGLLVAKWSKPKLRLHFDRTVSAQWVCNSPKEEAVWVGQSMPLASRLHTLQSHRMIRHNEMLGSPCSPLSATIFFCFPCMLRHIYIKVCAKITHTFWEGKNSKCRAGKKASTVPGWRERQVPNPVWILSI